MWLIKTEKSALHSKLGKNNIKSLNSYCFNDYGTISTHCVL